MQERAEGLQEAAPGGNLAAMAAGGLLSRGRCLNHIGDAAPPFAVC